MGEARLDSAEAVQHHRIALEQYTTVIRYMRAEASRSEPNLRTALLTCLVIFCFEAWVGFKESAVQQIQTGLCLAQNWRGGHNNEHKAPEAPSRTTPGLEDDLVRASNRLDVQAIGFTFLDEYDHERQDPHEKAFLERMPRVFDSVRDAEIYKNIIFRQTRHFLSFRIPLPKLQRPYIMLPVNGWYGVRSSNVVTSQRFILKETLKWEAAFDLYGSA